MRARRRGDIDDRSATLVNHVREDRPATEIRPGQVDGDHPVPRVFRRIQHRTVCENSRAIEKNIESSMLVHGCFNHAVYLR